MSKRKYRLLRSLTFTQLFAVLIGIVGLGGGYLWITRDSYRIALGHERAKVLLSLDEPQAKWRTWKQLGLDEALHHELVSHCKVFALSTLEVRTVDSLPKELTREEVIIPDLSQPIDDGLVVYARLNPAHIRAMYVPYRSNLLLLALCGLLFSGVILVSARYIRRNLYVPFLELRQVFEDCNAGKEVNTERIKANGEIREFIVSLVELYKKLKENEKNAAMVAVAKQVAHDIRSPLSALDMILDTLPQLPEQKRLIVRGALGRIRDIANNILERSRRSLSISLAVEAANFDSQTDFEPGSVQSAASLVDEIVGEKKILLRSRPSVRIVAEMDESAYGLFAIVQPQAFKTVLSNLLNNALEAMGETGVATVTVAGVENRMRIVVADDGIGMSEETLGRLRESGGSFGKAEGMGLGLSHARAAIARWGGQFEIESQQGVGTRIALFLPLVTPPSWFVPSIDVVESTTVLILDDDPNIHLVWQQRFQGAMALSGVRLHLEHFSNTVSLRRWCTENQRLMPKILFLCDYEIMGANENGIELIRSLYLTCRSILVTGRYDEEAVREACERDGIRLLPKGLGGCVPVRIARACVSVDAILVDDDPLVHMTWELAAKTSRHTFRGFYSIEDFLRSMDGLDRATPVYVDRYLGTEEQGDQASRRVNEAGFGEIYIATGDLPEPSIFPWIKEVRGKNPPWETLH
jgi:signal transduction histidine kinase